MITISVISLIASLGIVFIIFTIMGMEEALYDTEVEIARLREKIEKLEHALYEENHETTRPT